MEIRTVIANRYGRLITNRKALAGVPPCQGWGRGFESHRPLQNSKVKTITYTGCCEVARLVFMLGGAAGGAAHAFPSVNMSLAALRGLLAQVVRCNIVMLRCPRENRGTMNIRNPDKFFHLSNNRNVSDCQNHQLTIVPHGPLKGWCRIGIHLTANLRIWRPCPF